MQAVQIILSISGYSLEGTLVRNKWYLHIEAYTEADWTDSSRQKIDKGITVLQQQLYNKEKKKFKVWNPAVESITNECNSIHWLTSCNEQQDIITQIFKIA